MPTYYGYPPWQVDNVDIVSRPQQPTVWPRVVEPLPFIPVIIRPMVLTTRLPKTPHRRCLPRVITPTIRKCRVEARGLYRVFNTAEYRLYRSQVRPPQEGDTPFATTSSLPYEPADVFGNGTWYVSMSYFNGVLDSGFLPLGQKGETYLRLEIESGSEVYAPPNGPNDWRLENVGGGVVRVLGYYRQGGGLRAGQWAIAYTTDGGEPAVDSPDVTRSIVAEGLALLEYDLPAQGGGTTVKVRLQTRRLDDATWRYSEDSEVKTITATVAYIGDAAGPLEAYRWVGRLPEYT